MNVKDLTLKEPEKLSPLLFDPEKEITAKDWQKMKDKLASYRQINAWGNFATQAMAVKILCPEKAGELNLDLAAWQGMKDRLASYRQANDWWNFSAQAMVMKILAAEEVAVTEKGLAITMPKAKAELAEPIPPLPQIKKY